MNVYLSEFIRMAETVSRAEVSGADPEDIFNFVKREYESVSNSTGIEVNWKWAGYLDYTGDTRALVGKIVEKAESLRKILIAIDPSQDGN